MFKYHEETVSENGFVSYFLVEGSPEYIAICFHKHIYPEIKHLDNDRKSILSNSIEYLVRSETRKLLFIERLEVNKFFRSKGKGREILEQVIESNGADTSMLVSLPIEDDLSLDAIHLFEFYSSVDYSSVLSFDDTGLHLMVRR